MTDNGQDNTETSYDWWIEFLRYIDSVEIIVLPAFA